MIWSTNCFAFAKFLSRFLALICHSYTQYFRISFLCAVVICLQKSQMSLVYWVLSCFLAAALATASVSRCYKQDSCIYSGETHTSDKLCRFCHHNILSQFCFISIGLLSYHVLSFSQFSLYFIPSVFTSTCHTLFPETSFFCLLVG